MRRTSTGDQRSEAESESESEADLLRHLRERMLRSIWPWELRPLLYELQAYLAKHPQSPEARLLEHEVREAMRQETILPYLRHGTPEMRVTTPRRRSPFRWLAVLGAAGVIIYAALRILGIL